VEFWDGRLVKNIEDCGGEDEEEEENEEDDAKCATT
jgi:hypothetical protein